MVGLSFTKMKTAGLPTLSAKLTKLSREKKTPAFSFNKVKSVSDKSVKPFNFAKFTKPVKDIKVKKVAILKKALKKVKNVGF